MMTVKSYVDRSKIHGFGLFAAEAIKKGDLIWRFDPRIDKVLSEKDFLSLPKLNQDFVMHYCYKTEGKYVICGDDGRYVNHSDNPNTEGMESEDGYGITIASRDIEKGQEITGNYEEFDEVVNIKRKENKFV